MHAANIQDYDGALLVWEVAKGRFSRLAKIWGDSKYGGRPAEAAEEHGWEVEVVSRPKDMEGFHVLPRRWVIERTFGWIGRYRRMSKDYEALCETGEALTYIAMINLMLHRLCPG